MKISIYRNIDVSILRFSIIDLSTSQLIALSFPQFVDFSSYRFLELSIYRVMISSIYQFIACPDSSDHRWRATPPCPRGEAGTRQVWDLPHGWIPQRKPRPQPTRKRVGLGRAVHFSGLANETKYETKDETRQCRKFDLTLWEDVR